MNYSDPSGDAFVVVSVPTLQPHKVIGLQDERANGATTKAGGHLFCRKLECADAGMGGIIVRLFTV